MSNAIQGFGTLYNNPFIFGPIFHSFYSSLKKKEKSILLSYLTLPLVLYPESHKFLVNANARSSVMTMVGKPGQRDCLYGLDERIAVYRYLTNTSLQYGVDLGVFKIDESFSINVLSEWPTNPICTPDQLRAAKRLGILFEPFDIPTIYRLLGVKRL